MATSCAQKQQSRINCCRVQSPYSFQQRLEALRCDPATGQPTADVDPTELDLAFGAHVTLTADGATLFVSDVNYNAGAQHEYVQNGAVYVYARYLAPCERACSGGSKCAWQFRQRLFQQNWCTREFEFQEGAGFGASIAASASGDVVAIGAPYQTAGAENSVNAGAVYVFRRNSRTLTYDAVQTFVAQSSPYVGDTQENAFFGSSVAVSRDGRTIAVGAPEADGYGAVYLYELVETSGIRVGCSSLARGAPYVFRQKVSSPDHNLAGQAGPTDTSAAFGTVVHLDEFGYTLVVSASGTNLGPPSFSLSFEESPPLSPLSPPLDVSPLQPLGPTSFSASFVPTGTFIDSGSVFVYRRALGIFQTCTQIKPNAVPPWRLVQRINHPQPQRYGRLGRRSLRITPDANWMAVAAVSQFVQPEDGSPNPYTAPTIGAVFLFRLVACSGLYELYQVLEPSLSPQESADLLNTTDSVALSDDACTIAVGYAGIDENADHTNSGRVIVYRYVRSTGEWQENQVIAETDPSTGDAVPRDGTRFGYATDLSSTGLTLVAGNYPLPPNSETDYAVPSYVETFDALPTCLSAAAQRLLH